MARNISIYACPLDPPNYKYAKLYHKATLGLKEDYKYELSKYTWEKLDPLEAKFMAISTIAICALEAVSKMNSDQKEIYNNNNSNNNNYIYNPP